MKDEGGGEDSIPVLGTDPSLELSYSTRRSRSSGLGRTTYAGAATKPYILLLYVMSYCILHYTYITAFNSRWYSWGKELLQLAARRSEIMMMTVAVATSTFLMMLVL